VTRALTASDLAIQYGMTPRYWTRMACEGKVPGAWQPSGGRGKWLFDAVAIQRWHRSRQKEVVSWPGFTKGERRQWHEWAREMGRTHRQIKCTRCGFYVIWEPRSPRLIESIKERNEDE